MHLKLKNTEKFTSLPRVQVDVFKKLFVFVQKRPVQA